MAVHGARDPNVARRTDTTVHGHEALVPWRVAGCVPLLVAVVKAGQCDWAEGPTPPYQLVVAAVIQIRPLRLLTEFVT
jgi:hypothetical protein